MRSISALGVRSVRRAAGRYTLTAVGATLGVAVLFGVMATNASIKAGLDGSLGAQRIPIVSISPIGSYGNTLPASIVDTVAALPGVGRANGVVYVNGTVTGTDTQLDIYGQKIVEGPAAGDIGDLPFSDFAFEGRLPAAGADEVSLSRTRARELGVGLGDVFDLTTRNGALRLSVVRIVDHPDPNGLVSFETAVRAQGQGEALQHVSALLGQGTSVEQWIAANQAALPGVRVTSGGGDDLRNAVSVVQNAFSALGLMAAFVGGFLIYLTLSTSVAERARTWGVLRAVGARRRDVVRAVLAEAMVIGVVATLGGIAVGGLLGAGLLRITQAMLDVPRGGLTITASSLTAAAALGLLIPPIAALAPAWRAARAEPVEAMRERHSDAAHLSRAWIAGAVLLALALLLAGSDSSRAGLRLAPLLFLFGSVLLVPVTLRPLAKLIGIASARLAPGLGDAAVNHLVRERARSAYTLGLVMVVLALVLAIGAMQASLIGALRDAFRIRFASDVTVWAWNGMPDDVAASIRGVEGAATSTAFRTGRAGVGAENADVELVVIETASFFAMQGFPWRDGDNRSAQEALTAGGAVLVPEVYAKRHGLGRGDELLVHTAQGPANMRVAGVFTTPERGVRLIVGDVDGQRLFNAGPVTGLELGAAEGVSAEELKSRVDTIVADRPGYFVNTTAGEERAIAADLERTFRPFMAVTLVAGIVGVLGLANTLGMGIVRRTREIGVLRAVGIGNGSLARMVLVESLTMSGAAFVLSLPLGWLLSRALLRSSSNALGFLVDLRTPWALMPTLLVAVALIAVAAAVGPARRIGRLDPVAALRFE